jgi:hypothetical protein
MQSAVRAALLFLFAAFAHAQGSEDTITLERTPCFGSCPAYLLRIRASGNVSFRQGPPGNRQPERTWVIEPADFLKLIEEFERIQFVDFDASYEATYTDGFQTIVGLTLGGKSKTVAHWNVAPLGLSELGRRIERVTNIHQWLHGDKRRLSLQSPIAGFALGGIEDLKNETFVRADAFYGIKPGMTPLMQAAAMGKVAELRRLVERGNDVNASDETGWTALMFAAVSVQRESVAMLLASGAQVDQRDNHGDTALLGVSAHRFGELSIATEIVALLLASGALASATNDLGESALMWAARAGNRDSIQALLGRGADPKQVDKTGHDALFYLRSAREGLAFDPEDVQRYDKAAAALEP